MPHHLHASLGPLRYHRGPLGGYKLIVEIDQAIVDYYRRLMPWWLRPQPQKYRAHVSVVRKEVPPEPAAWGRHEGEVVGFCYSGEVHSSATYYWLNVFSTRLEELRLELGLSVEEKHTPPPPGFRKTFHTTLGNRKEHADRLAGGDHHAGRDPRARPTA